MLPHFDFVAERAAEDALLGGLVAKEEERQANAGKEVPEMIIRRRGRRENMVKLKG